jgi:hypothetical protein
VTSSNGKVAIVCRRAINWHGFYRYYGKRTFGPYSIGQMMSRWDADNPTIPYYAYRQSLAKLAKQTWERTGAAVYQNYVKGDLTKVYMKRELWEKHLCRYEWVVPIDDDDWLSPAFIEMLSLVPESCVSAEWDAEIIRIIGSRVLRETPRSRFNDSNATIFSPCYALKPKFLLTNSDFLRISYYFLEHGWASDYAQAMGNRHYKIRETGSVYLRHQATAGSSAESQRHVPHQLQTRGRRTIKVFEVGHEDIPPWVREYLMTLREEHKKMTENDPSFVKSLMHNIKQKLIR